FYILRSTFLILHSPFLILHSPFLIPHSTFPVPHSSFYILPSSFLVQKKLRVVTFLKAPRYWLVGRVNVTKPSRLFFRIGACTMRVLHRFPLSLAKALLLAAVAMFLSVPAKAAGTDGKPKNLYLVSAGISA